jgi:hypothetical protein
VIVVTDLVSWRADSDRETSVVAKMPKPNGKANLGKTNLVDMRSVSDVDSSFREHIKNVGKDVSTEFCYYS